MDRDFLQRTSDESDGYLFSFQLTEPDYGGDLGEDFAEYRRRFEPQTHELASDSELYLPVRELLREVNQPDDPVWRERVESYVDLAQFVTQAAIENYLAEDDGLLGVTGMNNFYLYRPRGTNRHRFIPWDKDGSFLLPGYSIVQRTEENILFRRAFGYGDLRALYLQVIEAAAQASSEDNWMEMKIRASQISWPAQSRTIRGSRFPPKRSTNRSTSCASSRASVPASSASRLRNFV